MMNQENFLVDFFVVGAAKSGTTWLARCCEEHPQIAVAKGKETGYFCHADRFLYSKLDDISVNPLEWYQEKFFSHCNSGQLNGDFSPLYLSSIESPAMIQNHNPNAKIIILLRDPADRAFSYHAQWTRNRFVEPSFEKAIKKYPYLIDSGKYYNQVKRYIDIFGSENTLIILYDDIQKDSEGCLKQVYNFLNVDSDIIPESIFTRVNARQVPRYRIAVFLYDMSRKILNASKSMKRVRDFLISVGIERLVDQAMHHNLKSAGSESLSKSTRKQLIGRYREDILQLSELIDRDLTAWIGQ